MTQRINKKSGSITTDGRRPGLTLAASFPAAALIGFGSLSTVYAGPTGGVVVDGQGTISTPNASTTVVDQASQRLELNWNTFDVGANERVQFHQPSTSAVALNRILDQNPSQIFGSIEANGQIILVNPNGLLFGHSAQLNVGSLVASALDVIGFDAASGRYTFGTSRGEPGAILNEGLISAASGGSVTLLGGQVSNTGTIIADFGAVNLAAGRTATLDLAGDGLLRLEVGADLLSNGSGSSAAVDNSGAIQANGGRVLLTAQALDGVFSNLVNNSGVVQANRIENRGGTIRLVGAGGTVRSSGTLDASAGDAVSSGGRVEVLGEHVGLFGNALVDVSGATNGGTVLIGGDYQGSNPDVLNATRTYIGANAVIDADAGAVGDGGKVIVWADDFTRHDGHISARGGAQSGDGGFAEVSGKQSLIFTGTANLGASHGAAGTLLLDPRNITIDASNTPQAAADDGTYDFDEDEDADVTIGNQRIEELLALGNLVLRAEGNITQIADAGIDVSGVDEAAGSSLTLEALSNIQLNGGIILNDGLLALDAGNDITIGGALHAGAGDVELVAGGSISGAGLISADALTASGTAIGSLGSRLNTAVDSLNVTSTNGGIFVTEVDTLTLTASATGGEVDVRTTNGAITVSSVTGNGVTLIAAGAGNGISLNGAVNAGAGDASLTATGAITGNGLVSANVLAASGSSLGTSGTHLATNVETLDAESTNGGIYISEQNGLRLRDVNAAALGSDVVVTSAAGDIVVETVSASDEVSLTASAGSITDDGSNATRISANSLTLSAAGAIGGAAANAEIDTTVSALTATANAGGVYIGESNGLTLTNVDAAGAGSDVVITSATGDIAVNTVTAADQVSLSAVTGAIVNDGISVPGVEASTLTLNAGTHIGTSAARLSTNATSLNATSANGGIFVTEASGLSLTASATNGEVDILTTNGVLTVASVSGDGVTLSAGGVGNGIVLNGTVDAGAGDADLTASGAISGTGQVLANAFTASGSSIGSGGTRLNTTVGSLDATSTNGGIFVTELNDLILTANATGGAVDVRTTNGALTVSSASGTGVTLMTSGADNGIALNGAVNAGAGDANLTATGAITGSGTVSAATLTASGASIGSSGTHLNTTVGTLNATSTNGGIFVTETSGLSLTASATNGEVDVRTTNGALNVASVSGDGVTLSAGGAGSGIVLNGDVNAGAGDAELTANGAIAGTGQVIANAFTASGSSLGSSGTRLNTTVGTLAVTSTSGGIFVTELDDLILTANATGGAVDVRTTNGALTVNSATGTGVTLNTSGADNGIALNGAVSAGAGNANLTATGAITGSGTVSAAGLTAFGSSIGTLGTRLNTNVSTLTATSTNGGIFVTEANGLVLNASAVGGATADVNVTSTAGNIVVGSVSAQNAVALTATTGAILDDGNDATAINGSAGISISAATNVGTVVDFGAENDEDVGSSVDIDTNGPLTVAVGSNTGQINLNLSGAPTLGVGAITLGSGSNRSGAVVLQSTGDLNLAGVVSGALNIGASNTTSVGLRSAGVLTLPAAGGFTDEPADRLLVRGAVDVVDNDASPREFAFAATALDFRSGGAGGDTTLNTSVARLDARLDSGSLIVNETTGVTLGSIVTAGDVTVAAAGAITDDNDDLTRIAGNAVALSGSSIGAAGNAIDTDAASLSASASSGGVYVREADALVLTASANGEPVDVQTVNGALTVTSASGVGITLAAGGAGSGISLNGAVNANGGNVVLTAGTPANRGVIAGSGLVSGDALTAVGAAIGTSATRLNTNVTTLAATSTSGGIYVSEVNSLNVTADAAGAVDVQTTNGALTVQAASGEGVTLVAGGAGNGIVLNGDVDAGAGDVALTAGGAITGTGAVRGDALTAAATTIGTSGVRLNTSVNSIAGTSTNGGLFITEADALNLSASATGGAVDVRTTNGALTVTSASGTGVILTAGGAGSALTLNGVVSGGAGDVVLTAGTAANRGAIAGSGLISGDELTAIASAIGTSATRLITSVNSFEATSTNGGIFVTEANALNLNASATGGPIDVQTTNGVITVAAASGDGVTLTAGGAGSGIALNGAVNAGAGDVTLTAGSAANRGEITGGTSHQISGNALTVTGSTLGASDARLSTAVATLDATSTNGGTFVTEANDLTLSANAIGTVDVRTTNGSLTVDSISGAGATLIAGGGGSGITLNTSVDVGNGDVTLSAGTAADRGAITVGSGVQIDASSLSAAAASIGSEAARLRTNVGSLNATSSNGGIFIAEANALNLTANATGGPVDVQTTNGAITVTSVSGEGVTLTAGGAGNGIELNGAVSAGADDVTLTAGGAISGAGLISGTTLAMTGAAIGSQSASLNTNVATLSANAGSGGVHIAEQNGLTLANVSAATNVSVTTAAGDLIVNEVSASNGIALTAAGAIVDDGDDTTLISGDTLTLVAQSIGGPSTLSEGVLDSSARLDTSVRTLSATTSAGGVFIDEADGLQSVNVHAAGGAAGDIELLTRSGDLNLQSVSASETLLLVAGRDILTSSANPIVANRAELRAGTTDPNGGQIGTFANPLNLELSAGNSLRLFVPQTIDPDDPNRGPATLPSAGVSTTIDFFAAPNLSAAMAGFGQFQGLGEQQFTSPAEALLRTLQNQTGMVETGLDVDWASFDQDVSLFGILEPAVCLPSDQRDEETSTPDC